MRIYVTRGDGPTDPETLWRHLLTSTARTSGTRDLVKALNTHVDFDRDLAPGTTLLIPDAEDVRASVGTRVGTEAIDTVLGNLEAGLSAVMERTRTGLAQLEADHKAFASALKSAPAKRLIKRDPELQQQLQLADDAFKERRKRATEAQSELSEIATLGKAEFARLRKLLES